MQLKIPNLKLYRNLASGQVWAPRWEPGPGLRRKGWKGQDLKSQTGEWLGLDEAVARARALNAEVAAWRTAGAVRRRPPPSRKPARTCRHLIEHWQATPEYQALAASTRADYASKASIWLAEFGDRAVAAIGAKVLRNYWRELHAARGHAMANGVLAVVRAALTHARQEEWIDANPAFGLKLKTVAPRCVVFAPAEIERLIAAAERLRLPSVADAIVIALHTGQRQGDVLALELPQAVAGRTVFRQSKTGARVSVPHTPELERRLEAVRARRAAGTIVDLALARRVVLDEAGRPYTRESFGRAWRQVRAAAAADMPAIAGKLFLDLRDTAVTRLALAGCTVPEIRAVTGHTLATVHDVLAHYLALDDALAASGIDRLKAWMTEEGIAI